MEQEERFPPPLSLARAWWQRSLPGLAAAGELLTTPLAPHLPESTRHDPTHIYIYIYIYIYVEATHRNMFISIVMSCPLAEGLPNEEMRGWGTHADAIAPAFCRGYDILFWLLFLCPLEP